MGGGECEREVRRWVMIEERRGTGNGMLMLQHVRYWERKVWEFLKLGKSCFGVRFYLSFLFDEIW